MKMTRFFVCFLLMLVLIPVGICESVDVESLSDDELQYIHNKTEDEMAERGIVRELEDGELAIYSGDYIVGVDIAPGKYVLSTIGGAKYSIQINKYKGAYAEYSHLKDVYDEYVEEHGSEVTENTPEYPISSDYYTYENWTDAPKHITLEEGNVLMVETLSFRDWQKVTIKKSTGLFMDE